MADRPSLDSDRTMGFLGQAFEGYMRLYGERLVASANSSILWLLLWGHLQWVRTLLLLLCFLLGYAAACLWFALPVVFRWPSILAALFLLGRAASHEGVLFTALFAVLLLPRIAAVGAGDTTAPESNVIIGAVKSYVFATAVTYPYSRSLALRILAVIVAMPVVNRLCLHALEGFALRELVVAQKRRDRRASAIAGAVRQQRQPTRPFVLYLRPFHVTAKQVTVDYFKALASKDNGPRIEEVRNEAGELVRYVEHGSTFTIGIEDHLSTHETNTDAEAAWERAVSHLGAFVGLGMANEAFGAGRVVTNDSDWRDTLVPLARAATLCIVLPSARAGTRWEIDWLVANHLLQKCCFYMPPKTEAFDFSTDWTAARDALAAVVDLPAYDPEGMLVYYDETGYRYCHPLSSQGAVPQPRVLQAALLSLPIDALARS